MMDRVSKDEDYMLYALLAGGAPYLVRDAHIRIQMVHLTGRKSVWKR